MIVLDGVEVWGNGSVCVDVWEGRGGIIDVIEKI